MVSSIRRFKLFGSRTLKTGISVFLTAFICMLFNLPVIFAVITAIVTIENTAADSIKKAAIRFPASAIGALLAALLYGLLGTTPLTYALATIFTIGVCYKLKLYDGILVATITAVAMIPDFNSHFIISFFIRLGTTSIGIIVSSLVNFFLLPPNYSEMIYKNIKSLYDECADILETTMEKHLYESKKQNRNMQKNYRQLTSQLEKTFQLSQFQREEWKYHRHSTNEMKAFQYAQKKLNILQQVAYHLGNLQYVQIEKNAFTEEEKQLLNSIISSISEILKKPSHGIPADHFLQIEKLDQEFWHWKEEHITNSTRYRHQLPPQTVVLYELLCLHDVLEELQDLAKNRYQLIHINS